MLTFFNFKTIITEHKEELFEIEKKKLNENPR